MRLIIIVFLLLPNFLLYSNDILLKDARQLFYNATKEEEFVEKALKKFELIKKYPDHKGLATTYIGSLTAMKALYTIFPHKKLSYANEGIKIMEEGVKAAPSNIESLFIYASTCYYLPFFFGKGDDAEKAFKEIIKLAEITNMNYEPEIVKNALEFILENADLTKEEKVKVDSLIKKYNSLI